MTCATKAVQPECDCITCSRFRASQFVRWGAMTIGMVDALVQGGPSNEQEEQKAVAGLMKLIPEAGFRSLKEMSAAIAKLMEMALANLRKAS